MIKKCCNECFYSPFLKDIIESNGNIGDCNFCSGKSSFLVTPSDLSSIFQNILGLYEQNNEGLFFTKQVLQDFPGKVVTFSNEALLGELIQCILGESIVDYEGILTSNVALKSTIISESQYISKWESFTIEIKEQNRFHIKNSFTQTELAIFLKKLVSEIYTGEIFYRARKSDKNGTGIDKMGKPPIEKTQHGRANPKGISYLYLANNPETTLYEVRSSLLDYVSIGKFQIQTEGPIEVLDIRRQSYNDIMQLADDDRLGEFLKHKEFMERLDYELSRPYGNGDRELDYLPTQYISELIKSLGYKGILYNSSLAPDGYNLVLFNGTEANCIDVEVFYVDSNTLNYSSVS